MKTINLLNPKTILILAGFLGLQINTMASFANSNEVKGTSNEAKSNLNTIIISNLTPVTPIVADFSDGAPATEFNFFKLAPVTPKEADFEDESDMKNSVSIHNLAPATPRYAEFEETL